MLLHVISAVCSAIARQVQISGDTLVLNDMPRVLPCESVYWLIYIVHAIICAYLTQECGQTIVDRVWKA